jgi:hypothetical protein
MLRHGACGARYRTTAMRHHPADLLSPLRARTHQFMESPPMLGNLMLARFCIKQHGDTLE